ncbi:MAG: hypothetical protein LBM69_09225 [Lachnospiraceae bacterium]|jgi:hypothetical protein|nr:hypothetical protein [Lachnospiraceae bacterium]
MRTFCTVYGIHSIRQMASDELSLPTNKQPDFSPSISWSQYIKLMRITNKDERRFYELEIADNGWNLNNSNVNTILFCMNG